MRASLILLTWLFGHSAFALEIPQSLGAKDRSEVIRILGLSTSTKLLSNPYPLGGHWGLELSVALEVIDTSNLSGLGTQAEPTAELRYPRITVGKGLYNNFDAFVNFIPFSEDNEVSGYGALLRWCFYEGDYLPVSLSALIHASSTNVSDSFVNQSYGYELVLGIIMQNFTLYFGGGPVNAQATFMGGDGVDTVIDPGDPNDPQHPPDEALNSNNVVKQTEDENHGYVGVSLHYDELFAAMQIDRYTTPVYSAKIGVRF